MIVHLGTSRVKIILDGKVYDLNMYSGGTITDGILAISSDDYILLESAGYTLTLKEGE